MTTADDVARTLNTVGLATWFGGSLMGVLAVRGSDGRGRASRDDTAASLLVENDVWTKWRPIQTAAIGAYLVGAAKLTTTNKGRVLAQRGVARAAAVKGVCTLGALGATWYASHLGSRIHHEAERAGGERSDDGQDRDETGLSEEATAVLGKLRMAQVAVPVLTGVALMADSRLGEQQRPGEVLRGVAARVVPDVLQSLPERLHLGDGGSGPAPLSEAVRSIEEVAKHLPDTARSLVAR